MTSRIYVGNLPYSFTSDDLQQLFSPHGSVVAAEVMMDRDTGRSRGFGFVTMGDAAAAGAAIQALDGHDVNGRALRVNEARERTERPAGGGPRGGGFGGGGGGRGGEGGGRGGFRDGGGRGGPRRPRQDRDGGGGGGGGGYDEF